MLQMKCSILQNKTKQTRCVSTECQARVRTYGFIDIWNVAWTYDKNLGSEIPPAHVIPTSAHHHHHHHRRGKKKKKAFCFFAISRNFPKKTRTLNLPFQNFPIVRSPFVVSLLDTLQLHIALEGSGDCMLIHLRSCSVVCVNPAGPRRRSQTVRHARTQMDRSPKSKQWLSPHLRLPPLLVRKTTFLLIKCVFFFSERNNSLETPKRRSCSTKKKKVIFVWHLHSFWSQGQTDI